MTSVRDVVGFLFVLAVLMLSIISITTSFWSVNSEGFHAGMWQVCSTNESSTSNSSTVTCHSIGLNDTYINGARWFNAIRIVSAVSCANAAVATALAFTYGFMSMSVGAIRIVQFLLVVLLTGGLELGSSVLVYAISHDDLALPIESSLGWSCRLAVATACLYFVSVVWFILETSRPRCHHSPIQDEDEDNLVTDDI